VQLELETIDVNRRRGSQKGKKEEAVRVIAIAKG
jgi:hypothetical protein